MRAPRLSEYDRQGQAEVVSNSRSKFHQTWASPFSRALYSGRHSMTLLRRTKAGPERLVYQSRNKFHQTWSALSTRPGNNTGSSKRRGFKFGEGSSVRASSLGFPKLVGSGKEANSNK